MSLLLRAPFFWLRLSPSATSHGHRPLTSSSIDSIAAAQTPAYLLRRSQALSRDFPRPYGPCPGADPSPLPASGSAAASRRHIELQALLSSLGELGRRLSAQVCPHGAAQQSSQSSPAAQPQACRLRPPTGRRGQSPRPIGAARVDSEVARRDYRRSDFRRAPPSRRAYSIESAVTSASEAAGTICHHSV